jgi:hypothetical protein
MKYARIIVYGILSFVFSFCGGSDVRSKEAPMDAGAKKIFAKGSFGYDLEFLEAFQDDLVVLGEKEGPQVIVSPAYQGRVMTSTADGLQGNSFGWINYDLIASGKPAEHINPVGGEERIWLGPEGGQFSIYFKKGSTFVFNNWYVPKELDTEPFTLVSANQQEAHFEKQMHLENYSGTKLDVKVDRTIRLLKKATIDSLLGIALPDDVKSVAFESDNRIVNTGKEAWTKQSGMLSIWILSMLNASPKTMVAIPFNKVGSGPIVTDDYFGKVPMERLKISDGLILFKADAGHRSKIGLSPGRAMPLAVSFDAEKNMLTIAQFTLPSNVSDYVNSLWKMQDDPFSGDAVNAYNDGPIEGKQMGKFYELESSSPAAALSPGADMRHVHRTIHLTGSRDALNKVAIKLLGMELNALRF